ncbi:MAG: LamG-like jellyroll fold domain-containing protein [Planctomycetia bacterium]|nr:LamG-like jellyroll fold domain-containing protein [Planctomycetia bacterium]
MKRFILGIAFVLIGLFLTPVAIADTIVGFWNFNTNTNNTVDGSEFALVEGNITGGTLNNGYITGTVTNLPVGAESYTISAYLKTTQGGKVGIVGWGVYGSDDQVTALRTTDPGSGLNHYWWANDQIANHNSDTWGSAANSGTWNHVVASADGLTQRVYINGQLLNTRTPSPHRSTNASFAVGATNAGHTEKLVGSLDNVGIYANAIEQTDIINIASARYNGMTNMWLGKDYTTGGVWTDRVSGITATVAGDEAYKPVGTGTSVVFSRESDNTSTAAGYFTTSAAENPIAGLNEFTILVAFTPDKVGTSDSSFYLVSGLVGAEQQGVVNDWGLGYNSSQQVVAGYGKATTDQTLNSATTVAVGTSGVAGMTVSGLTLSNYVNGALSTSKTLGSNENRNSNVAMYIGRMGYDGGYYSGAISDVRIFNRALTTSEMAYYSGQMAADHVYTIATKDSDVLAIAAGLTGKETLWVQTTDGAVDLTQIDVSALPAMPLGIYLGGFTETAQVTVNHALLNATNRTLVLGGGRMTWQTGNYDVGFQKTLDIDGGVVTAASSLNLRSDARVTVSSGSLTTGTMRIGLASEGGATLVQNGGTVTVNGWLTLGENDGSGSIAGGVASAGGHYELHGGTLALTGAADRFLSIGDSAGSSTFTMTGGTLNAGTHAIKIGTRSGATGTLLQSGGAIQASEVIVGVSGTGAWNYSGGTISAEKVTVNATGTMATSVGVSMTGAFKELVVDGGKYENSGANAGSSYLRVGTASGDDASVTVKNGGTLSLPAASNAEIDLGRADGASGSLKLEGGTVSANNTNIAKVAGSTGTFEQTGGTATFGNWFTMADQGGTGTYTRSAGSLSGNNALIGNAGTATFTQTGGSSTFNNVTIGNKADSNGTMNIDGGSLDVADTLTVGSAGTGALNLTSGRIYTQNLANASNMTWTGGFLAAKTVTGDLNQQGGTLIIGQIPEGVTWAKTFYGSSASPNSAFWERIAGMEPSATNGATDRYIGAGLETYGVEYYTIVYKGQVYIDSAGEYTFSFTADDGGFILIDGREVSHMSSLDREDPWEQSSVDTPVTLSEGFHDIEYRYYQGYGGTKITRFQVSGVDGVVNLLADNDMLYGSEMVIDEMTISGNYTLAEGARLEVDINLTDAEWDKLFVTGDATLEGVLSITTKGFSTESLEINLINTDGQLIVDFSDILLNGESVWGSPWDVSGLLPGGDGILRYGGVPEPASWLLMLGGGLLLGFRFWKVRRGKPQA